MTESYFGEIIKDIRTGNYKFKPSKIVEIPKAKGGTRKIAIPCKRDKIVQMMLHIILEKYFEPKFKNTSFGFRKGISPHSALLNMKYKWKYVTWAIKGDITECFDSFDHKLLIKKLGRVIYNEKFTVLMHKSLKAGYLEQGIYKISDEGKGEPQENIVSTILSNIYLHEFDVFMERMIILFNNKEKRDVNPLYTIIRKTKGINEIIRRGIPSGKVNDPEFRRLYYVRYAEDFVIGVIGNFDQASMIKKDVLDSCERN